MQFDELAREFFDNVLKSPNAPCERERHALPRGEFGILVYLSRHKDGANVGELTEYLQVTSGRTATALNALEKKGFVKRVTDSADSRRIRVFLTDEGKAEFKAAYDRAIVNFTEFFTKLGEEDSREYIRMMKKVHSTQA